MSGVTEKEATELMRSFVQCHRQCKACREQSAGANRNYKELSSDVRELLSGMQLTELNFDNVTVRLKARKKPPSTNLKFWGEVFSAFLQQSQPSMSSQQVDAQRQQFLDFTRAFKQSRTETDTELQVLDRSVGLKM